MIVTLDASILVRATGRSAGPARRVVDALATNADHVIALSPFILGEVGRVLSYPRMQALYKLSVEEIEDHFSFSGQFPASSSLRAACPWCCLIPMTILSYHRSCRWRRCSVAPRTGTSMIQTSWRFASGRISS